LKSSAAVEVFDRNPSSQDTSFIKNRGNFELMTPKRNKKKQFAVA
jgi:hypothetical protein